MKVTGTVESLAFDDRSGKLKLRNLDNNFWINDLVKPQTKGITVGDLVTVEANPGRSFDFVTSIEKGEAASLEDEKQTGSTHLRFPAEQPPKPYTPTKDKGLPPTPGKGRACSTRFMAKFRDLVKAGKTPEEIADEYCFSVQEVYQNIAALETKEKIEKNVTQVTKPFDTDFDTIRPTHYRLISRVPDEEKQVELAREVAEKNLSVRELDKKIKGEEPRSPPPPRPEWVDCGGWTCPECKENYRLVHVAEGRHRFEPVEVVEKK